ncbi:TolC family outer membrane protein [Thauera aromatica]|uniref:Type I secretion outer membrane protein, TolC n=1 Tax=Thauera aromatica K172 TaxID=44139 RepID=A0A2R4BL11_THAAR|nr:TolC family outer membrane protein [Thauera aromatica]AVR87904.1 Type I secretion outer membrane protein, TolC precursor [Thauera aromatica K172]
MADSRSLLRLCGAWLRSLVVAAALGAVCAPAWSLDLMQAYQAALAQDATIRAARAARDAAVERLPQARAQLLPNIAISLGRNKNDIDRTQENSLGQEVEFGDEYFSYNQSLQLRQPLFRMPLFAGLRQAGFVVDDAEATLERELQDLGARVAGAYMEALLAQDALDLVLKQKAVTTTQLDAARKSLEAGFGTRTDIDEAQARLDMNMADELSARQHVDFTRRQLEILIDQPVDALAGIDAERLPLLPPEPADVTEWVRLAEENSPEVRALEARLEAARAEIAKARGGHYPTVDAVAQISRSGSENVTSPSSSYTNRLIGLQVNIPLFAGGYVNSTVRQAIAEQTRAEENLEAVRRDLAVRVHREHRGVTEGVLKVRALEQAARSAQQLVRSSRRSFEAGSRTTVDVLNAEQQLQVTLRDLAEARYLYLVSRVRLRALVGQDRERSVAEINAWLKG